LVVQRCVFRRRLGQREGFVKLTGGQPVWRERVVTDNGNWVLDLHGLAITDPVGLERELNQIPGIVSVGLFARRPADIVIVGEQTPRVLR